MSKVLKLRNLIEQPGVVVAPGVYDCIGAHLVEKTGYQAVYMGGNGAVASKLGKPDIGLATMNQMADWAGTISACVNLPLICDFDNGYGDLNNVHYGIQTFERAGIAAIHLEDQVFPKKCGAMKGVAVIPKHDAANKVKIAVKTRKEMLIIARSDCLSVRYDLDEMIGRLRAFSDAGADILYPESVKTLHDIEKIVKSVDKPVMIDILECVDKENIPTVKQLESVGVKIVVNALSLIWYNAMQMKKILENYMQFGDLKNFSGDMMNIHDYERLVGIDEANSINDLLD